MIHSAVDIVDELFVDANDDVDDNVVVGRRRAVVECKGRNDDDGARRSRLLTALSSLSFARTLLLRLLPPLRLIEDIDDGWDEEKACTASAENGNDDCAPLRRQRLPPDDDEEEDDAKSTIIAAIAEDERLFPSFIVGQAGVWTNKLGRIQFLCSRSFGESVLLADITATSLYFIYILVLSLKRTHSSMITGHVDATPH
jgi:hypothetical protein